MRTCYYISVDVYVIMIIIMIVITIVIIMIMVKSIIETGRARSSSSCRACRWSLSS